MRRTVLLLGISLSLLASPAASQPASGRKTAESLRNNVVYINVAFSEGTTETGFGLIVAEDNGKLLIVTANHVVRRADSPEDSPPEITVQLHCIRGSPWRPADRLSTGAAELDLAVLEASAADCVWQRKALAPTVVGLAGADAWFIGRGDELYIPHVSGKISSNEPNLLHTLHAEFPAVVPGSSGGPLLTQDGIVGMIKKGQGVGGETRALSIETVRKLVQTEWNLPWQLETWSPVSFEQELSTLRETWPVVLREPLQGFPPRALLTLGQYGAEKSFAPSPGGGLRIGGANSSSVAWWDDPVEPPFLVSVDLKIERKDIVRPNLWILGPGYGVNRESSYVLAIEDAQRIFLYAEGLARRPAPAFLGEALTVEEWYPVDLLVEKGKVKLFLKGKAVAEWPVPSLPTGPLHSFLGLGAQGGATYLHEPSAAVFRNLEVRRPPASGGSQATPRRQLDPPALSPSDLFAPCPAPSVSLDFTQSVPQAAWTVGRDPGAVNFTPEGLLLRVGNETPSVWLDPKDAEDFAAEYLVQLPDGTDSVNLRFLVSVGVAAHLEKDVFDGWVLAFPTGSGRVELRQIVSTQGGHDFWSSYDAARLVAQASSYSPVNGRDYRIRFERNQGKLRVLSNSGVLFEVQDPWAGKDGGKRQVRLGITKIHGGVLIKQVLVWTHCPSAAKGEPTLFSWSSPLPTRTDPLPKWMLQPAPPDEVPPPGSNSTVRPDYAREVLHCAAAFDAIGREWDDESAYNAGKQLTAVSCLLLGHSPDSPLSRETFTDLRLAALAEVMDKYSVGIEAEEGELRRERAAYLGECMAWLWRIRTILQEIQNADHARLVGKLMTFSKPSLQEGRLFEKELPLSVENDSLRAFTHRITWDYSAMMLPIQAHPPESCDVLTRQIFVRAKP